MSLYVPAPYHLPAALIDLNDPLAFQEYQDRLLDAHDEAPGRPLTTQSRFTFSFTVPPVNENPNSRSLPDCAHNAKDNVLAAR
jgi:hypothetical protein